MNTVLSIAVLQKKEEYGRERRRREEWRRERKGWEGRMQEETYPTHQNGI
jgi:hypothetical protein